MESTPNNNKLDAEIVISLDTRVIFGDFLICLWLTEK